MDSSFGSVQSFVVWFDELYITFHFGEKLFDVICCLIVHHVHLNFEPLCFEHFESLLVGFEYYGISEAGDWCGKDAVGFVVVHDEGAHALVQLDKWEVAGHVVVHDSGPLVGKCTKAENFCYQCVTAVRDNALIPAHV